LMGKVSVTGWAARAVLVCMIPPEERNAGSVCGSRRKL
jgi:hypothetical protein